MAADWMVDDSGIAEELREFARRAGEGLVAARAAVERFDGKPASAGQRRALRAAAARITEIRRRLRDLDRDLLADAEGALEELLQQDEPSTLRLVTQKA